MKNIYEITVTYEIAADSEDEAYDRWALDGGAPNFSEYKIVRTD